eukprot:scaffold66626_cov19-Tisochrysis_lutea.AAC.1
MLSAFTATLDLLCATFVEHLIGLPTLCTDAQPPHINRMHTICHIEALSICGEKLAREALAPTLLLWMHAIEEGPPLQVIENWEFLMRSKEAFLLEYSHLDSYPEYNSAALMPS